MTEDMFEGAAKVRAPRKAPPPRTDRAAMRDPFVITDRTAISLSGGRTSAYMLHRVLESNGGLPDCARVMFANTGLEHEATLEFVRDIGEHWQVPIHWVEWRDTEQGYEIVNFDTASRNGEPYEALIRKRKYLPNPVTRFCTSELKIRAMHRHLRTFGWHDDDEGWDQFIGIRGDEPRRIAKIRARGVSTESSKESSKESMLMPLAEAGVGKSDVGNFWRQQPFDLKLPNTNGVTKHGNCLLCFLKPGAQVFSLISEEPSRAIWYMKQEAEMQSSGMTTGDGARFRTDRPSYAQMHAFALAQGDLFRESTLNVEEQAMIDMLSQDDAGIDCFCGDGS